VERLLDQKKPVCIIDPKGDWWGLKSSADGKKPGYPIIIFGSEFARHADFRINAHSGAGVAELVATGNRPCLIDLKGMRVGERTHFFIHFASTYFAKAAGERVLVIDEVHHFAPQGKVPDPQIGEMLHWANRLVNEGSGMGITMMSASQRPQKVHKDYTSAHETLIACRVITKHDREAIKDWIDACGDPVLGKEIINSLAGMPRTEAWVYSPETSFGPARLIFPMFSTYDSFKPQAAKGAGTLKGWAEIDRTEVEAKLTKVVEEAKANDPKELRKQVSELSANLKKLETAKQAALLQKKADPDALKAAEERGFEQAKKKLVAAATRTVDAIMRAAMTSIDKRLREGFAGAREQIGGDIVQISSVTKVLGADLVFEPSAPVQPAPQIARPMQQKPPAAQRSALPRREAAPTGDPATTILTNPQLQLLKSLAWWAAMGHERPTRTQVAAIAGWKPKGSNLRNRITELSTAGLIVYLQSGTVQLTDTGAQVAPAPDVGMGLIDSVRGACTKPMLALFDALLQFRDESTFDVTRDELAAAVGWEAGGSNLRNRLTELSAMEVVEYPDRGTVRLQEWVKDMRLAA